MAEVVASRLGLEIDPQHIVAHINAYLFDEQGFRGNQEDYYDTRNSFLNEVIARKTGIPITLSVLYIELARQVGLPSLVSARGIFWCAIAPSQRCSDRSLLRGKILSRGLSATSDDMYGQMLAWSDVYLQPVSDHAIPAYAL
jgi:hypothetical protein